jgi:hypothetical protein
MMLHLVSAADTGTLVLSVDGEHSQKAFAVFVFRIHTYTIVFFESISEEQ